MNIDNLEFARRFDNVSGSAIREILKLTSQPGVISFAGGNPSLSALPDGMVAEISADVMKKDGKRILQYGATEGYGPFLESLREYVNSTVKPCGNVAILPVTGSTQAMDLLCKALINPGDNILVENPSFLGNMQCMKLYEANLVPLESDSEGIVIEDLARKIEKYKPKILYVIPNFQNPTGKTLPVERRRLIAQIASESGVVVAEDDPYRDLRYEGNALPTIKSFDQNGWVVYMGSFSKIISPGLRVGYMAGSANIIRKCTVGKQSSDVHTANLNQAIVDSFLRQNLLPSHIDTICKDYKVQLDAMLDELEKFPEGTFHTSPEGGLFIWVELPDGIDAEKIFPEVVANGVAYVPGTYFYCDGGHKNTLRLNFSASSTGQIHEGMEKLRVIIENKLKEVKKNG